PAQLTKLVKLIRETPKRTSTDKKKSGELPFFLRPLRFFGNIVKLILLIPPDTLTLQPKSRVLVKTERKAAEKEKMRKKRTKLQDQKQKIIQEIAKDQVLIIVKKYLDFFNLFKEVKITASGDSDYPVGTIISRQEAEKVNALLIKAEKKPMKVQNREYTIPELARVIDKPESLVRAISPFAPSSKVYKCANNQYKYKNTEVERYACHILADFNNQLRKIVEVNDSLRLSLDQVELERLLDDAEYQEYFELFRNYARKASGEASSFSRMFNKDAVRIAEVPNPAPLTPQNSNKFPPPPEAPPNY
ncbi:25980_t:CDS:2, partial [Racocetra persica]